MTPTPGPRFRPPPRFRKPEPKSAKPGKVACWWCGNEDKDTLRVAQCAVGHRWLICELCAVAGPPCPREAFHERDEPHDVWVFAPVEPYCGECGRHQREIYKIGWRDLDCANHPCRNYVRVCWDCEPMSRHGKPASILVAATAVCSVCKERPI